MLVVLCAPHPHPHPSPCGLPLTPFLVRCLVVAYRESSTAPLGLLLTDQVEICVSFGEWQNLGCPCTSVPPFLLAAESLLRLCVFGPRCLRLCVCECRGLLLAVLWLSVVQRMLRRLDGSRFVCSACVIVLQTMTPMERPL